MQASWAWAPECLSEVVLSVGSPRGIFVLNLEFYLGTSDLFKRNVYWKHLCLPTTRGGKEDEEGLPWEKSGPRFSNTNYFWVPLLLLSSTRLGAHHFPPGRESRTLAEKVRDWKREGIKFTSKYQASVQAKGRRLSSWSKGDTCRDEVGKGWARACKARPV